MDFIKNLDADVSVIILSYLDDTSDLVRASAVSRSWRNFVIEHRFSKNLCLKLFPQLYNVIHITETSSSETSPWQKEKEHRVYVLLARRCISSPIKSCIADAVVASSTDDYLSESIIHTLEERDRVGRTPSYWSSIGEQSNSVPETLIYKLKGDLCVVTEFKIQPFQIYFQPGGLIFSSQYVRFRLGHRNNNSQAVESNYVWTYTSQEFPMAQENRLQTFTLPEPVLCIGGYVLIELLGRVQTHEMNGLYYICVSHVKVMGRSLAKSFQVLNLDDSGKFGLKVMSYSDSLEVDETEEEAGAIRSIEQLFHTLHRNHLDDDEYVWHESDGEGTESDYEDAESDDEI